MQLFNRIPSIDLSKLTSIFEIGGGYGSLCRLIRRLGFQGNYTILDLPEFSCLQKIYLQKIGVGLNNISFINNIDTSIDVDLFISFWAIDEVPKVLRNKVLELVKPKMILIAYNNADRSKNLFNNPDCLSELKKNTNYNWLEYEMHLPGNYYLIGEIK